MESEISKRDKILTIFGKNLFLDYKLDAEKGLY